MHAPGSALGYNLSENAARRIYARGVPEEHTPAFVQLFAIGGALSQLCSESSKRLQYHGTGHPIRATYADVSAESARS